LRTADNERESCVNPELNMRNVSTHGNSEERSIVARAADPSRYGFRYLEASLARMRAARRQSEHTQPNLGFVLVTGLIGTLIGAKAENNLVRRDMLFDELQRLPAPIRIMTRYANASLVLRGATARVSGTHA
jgi:hypothetical protein